MTGAALLALALLPAPAGAQALTLDAGIEARVRVETMQGDVPRSDRWLRVLPHAQVEAGPLRLFVQGIATAAAGAPDPGPTDTTGIDLLQGHATLTLNTGAADVTLLAGRTLIALGSERLVGRRYGANVPRAFEGATLTVSRGRVNILAMALHPVRVGRGDFDDRADPLRRLNGVQARWSGPPVSVDLYWLDDRRTGIGTRATLGVRVYGAQGPWRWNWEAMRQRGEAEGRRIRAWSLASETALVLHPLTLQLRAAIASGDQSSRDAIAGTFDPLYPKAQYFGELSPIGPRNMINLHPGIDLALGERLTVSATAIAYWRHRRGDGVYDLAGTPLHAPGGRARRIGSQIEVGAEWRVRPGLSVSGTLAQFRPAHALGGATQRLAVVEVTLTL